LPCLARLRPGRPRAARAHRRRLRVARCATDADAAAPDRPPPRFAVGERVECNVDSWMLGEVVRHWYREPGWPEGQVVPYQVKLDSGMTIFAPFDEDECIRKAVGILSYGKIPVTVLTGFLGAGKTTLLNYILGVQHGKKYAVIENEFGDVPIDEMLLNQDAGKFTTMESITVLDNGCLCCTMRDDLVAAIQGIVRTVEGRLEKGVPDAMIDGILIETTGIADPGPICKTFSLDSIVNAYCKIDGILTVVDAAHFLEQLGRERPPDTVNEPAQQVAFADKVLLNKVDAVSRERVEETVSAIRGVNTLVPIVECSLAIKPDAVPIGELLAIDAFDATKLLTEDNEMDLGGAAPKKGHEHSHEEHGGHCEHSEHGSCHDAECTDPACEDPSCGHEHSDHGHSHSQKSPHDTDIGTMLLEMSGAALNVDRFQAFLDGILAERSVDLYRYKGVLAVEARGVIVRYVLQGVHDMAQVSFSGEWPSDKPVKTQVVIIGRKLEKDLWQERFAACAESEKQTVRA